MNLKEINNIKNLFLESIHLVKDKNDLKKIKQIYLSRNGLISNQLKNLSKKNIKEKIILGKELNNLKNLCLSIFEKTKNDIHKTKKKYFIDSTLPDLGKNIGKKHIINQTIFQIENFFSSIGFKSTDGIEIDSSLYNFNFLNMKKDHPSRSLNESFFIKKNLLLRTHTSNMQIHLMKKYKAPFKFISYGKVYRRDSDISHTPMFHQLEVFVVDKNLSMSNLKFLLIKFLSFFFKKNVEIRMRPSYFPFTEPSSEVDIKCVSCLGEKCATCKYSGWIEILGCGMIHPKVLKNCKIKENYNGFAFGLGIERITMIKHKINDLRLFYNNNIEFLKQF